MSRAALMTRINAPLELAEIRPLGELHLGQVLVEILRSGICGSQLQEMSGVKQSGPLPHPLGHEGCGIVIQVGPAVSRVRAGDKVIMHWRKGLGLECAYPAYTSPTHGNMTGGLVTTFGERMVCSENRLTTVPPTTDPDLCALLGCGLSTALGTIEQEAKLRFGERILVVGCGGLGVNLILAARLAQAAAITVTDGTFSKEKIARSLGASSFVRPVDIRLCGNYDVIVNTTDSIEMLELTLPLLASGGRYVLVGQPKAGEAARLLNVRHFFDGEGKTFMATQGGRFNPSRDIPRYVAMHEAGLLDVKPLISHHLPFEQINEAIEMVRGGYAGRVMLHMSK